MPPANRTVVVNTAHDAGAFVVTRAAKQDTKTWWEHAVKFTVQLCGSTRFDSDSGSATAQVFANHGFPKVNVQQQGDKLFVTAAYETNEGPEGLKAKARETCTAFLKWANSEASSIDFTVNSEEKRFTRDYDVFEGVREVPQVP